MEDIHKEMEDMDILFLEARDESNISRRTRVLNYLAVPGLLLFLNIYLYLINLPKDKLTDNYIKNAVEEEYNVKTVKVDSSIQGLLSQERKLWALFHWGALAPPIILFKFGVDLSLNMTIMVVFSLIIIYYIFIVSVGFLVGTFSGRNSHMILNIQNVQNRDDVDQALILVGSSHAQELADFAEDIPNIEPNILHAYSLKDNIKRIFKL